MGQVCYCHQMKTAPTGELRVTPAIPRVHLQASVQGQRAEKRRNCRQGSWAYWWRKNTWRCMVKAGSLFQSLCHLDREATKDSVSPGGADAGP